MPLIETFGDDSARAYGETINSGPTTSAGLYPFAISQYVTFTPGGVTGRSGPNLSQSIAGLSSNGATTWANNTAFFNMVTNGYQLWTVPASGTYQFIVAGASGPTNLGAGVSSGAGRIVNVTYNLATGIKLNIVVGQQGSVLTGNGGSTYTGGGGGASWVVDTNNTIYAIGGGGGSGHNDPSYGSLNGWNAPAATYGTTDTGTSNGLSGQGGGNSGDSTYGGGGGGGYSSNGAGDSNAGAGIGGTSYLGGLLGGYGWLYPSTNQGNTGGGGFGGGGGGWVNTETRPGAGGGYSGGDGSTYGSNYAGGGGGSYLGLGATSSSYGSINYATGYVTVTRIA